MNIWLSGIKLTKESIRIGDAATIGTLLELATTPKPGLVDKTSSGSHEDMDYTTFLSSTAAISPYFPMIAAAAQQHDGPIDGLLTIVRRIGIQAEEAMFAVTTGVNTQKGLVFSQGLVCAAAGYATNLDISLDTSEILSLVSRITQGITHRELECTKTASTSGEKLYKMHGLTGARGEAEAGYPSVLLSSESLSESISQGLDFNAAMIQALFILMDSMEDTTVVHRAGLEGLDFMRQSASRFLACGGMSQDGALEEVKRIDQEFQARRISPGGCADLLAVTATLYELQKNACL